MKLMPEKNHELYNHEMRGPPVNSYLFHMFSTNGYKDQKICIFEVNFLCQMYRLILNMHPETPILNRH